MMSKSGNDAETISEGGNNDGYAAACSHCGRKFSQHKGLYAHMRLFHPDERIVFKGRCAIICCLCDETHQTMSAYYKHIHSEHPTVRLSFEKKFFYCDEDFSKWKLETESRTQSHYTVSRADNELSDGRISKQYMCDRSGFFRPSGKTLRQFSGSKKIGKTCPATISIIKTVADDLMEIEVTFQTEHAGHKFDVHSLRRRSEKREKRLLAQARKAKSAETSTEPIKDVHNIRVTEKTESCIKDISDIFRRDPDLEIEDMFCTCQEYATSSKCEHVLTILKSINPMSSNPSSETIREDSFCAKDPFYVEVDEADKLADSEENAIAKFLEEEKASLLGEFQRIVDKCTDLEQVHILKKVIEEGETRLSATQNTRSSPKIVYLQSPPSSALDSGIFHETTSSSPGNQQNNQVILQQSTHLVPPTAPLVHHSNNLWYMLAS